MVHMLVRKFKYSIGLLSGILLLSSVTCAFAAPVEDDTSVTNQVTGCYYKVNRNIVPPNGSSMFAKGTVIQIEPWEGDPASCAISAGVLPTDWSKTYSIAIVKDASGKVSYQVSPGGIDSDPSFTVQNTCLVYTPSWNRGNPNQYYTATGQLHFKLKNICITPVDLGAGVLLASRQKDIQQYLEPTGVDSEFVKDTNRIPWFDAKNVVTDMIGGIAFPRINYPIYSASSPQLVPQSSIDIAYREQNVDKQQPNGASWQGVVAQQGGTLYGITGKRPDNLRSVAFYPDFISNHLQDEIAKIQPASKPYSVVLSDSQHQLEVPLLASATESDPQQVAVVPTVLNAMDQYTLQAPYIGTTGVDADANPIWLLPVHAAATQQVAAYLQTKDMPANPLKITYKKQVANATASYTVHVKLPQGINEIQPTIEFANAYQTYAKKIDLKSGSDHMASAAVTIHHLLPGLAVQPMPQPFYYNDQSTGKFYRFYTGPTVPSPPSAQSFSFLIKVSGHDQDSISCSSNSECAQAKLHLHSGDVLTIQNDIANPEECFAATHTQTLTLADDAQQIIGFGQQDCAVSDFSDTFSQHQHQHQHQLSGPPNHTIEYKVVQQQGIKQTIDVNLPLLVDQAQMQQLAQAATVIFNDVTQKDAKNVMGYPTVSDLTAHAQINYAKHQLVYSAFLLPGHQYTASFLQTGGNSSGFAWKVFSIGGKAYEGLASAAFTPKIAQSQSLGFKPHRTVFAPYLDPTMMMTAPSSPTGEDWVSSLQKAESVTKQNAHGAPMGFTQAFITSQGQCTPTLANMDPNVTASGIKQSNMDYYISFGGASGTMLAESCDSADSLAAQYEKMYNIYKSSHFLGFDFDIEGGAPNNKTLQDNFPQALSIFHQRHPNAEIWLTLATMPDGLTDSKTIVDEIIKQGVPITGIDLMAMDYGENVPDMGQAAISSAEALHSYLADEFKKYGRNLNETKLWSMVAITPMIGKNDNGDMPFSEQNAQALLSAAQAKSKAGTPYGGIRFWSLDRDNYDSALAGGPTHSGVMQDPWDFTNILRQVGATE